MRGATDTDHGEPHDEPSPFPVSGKYGGDAARMRRDDAAGQDDAASRGAAAGRGAAGRDDARDTPQRTRTRPARDPRDAERDAVVREIRALQDKLRRGA